MMAVPSCKDLQLSRRTGNVGRTDGPVVFEGPGDWSWCYILSVAEAAKKACSHRFTSCFGVDREPCKP